MDLKQTLYDLLRWLAMLPAAALCSWIAYFLVGFGGRLGMASQGVNPDSLLATALWVWTSHAAAGAAWVYSGARVAPRHKAPTAYCMSGIGLIGVGFVFYPAAMMADYWAVWGGFSFALGAAGVAAAALLGEVPSLAERPTDQGPL